MKTILILIAVFLQTILANGQSLSSSVISTAGDYYTANGNTLSVTIGETMIDNYTSGNANLSTGFQQGTRILNIKLNVIVMLQEYYNTQTGLMNLTKGIDWNTGDLYNNFGDTIVDTLSIQIRKTNVNDISNPCSIVAVFHSQNLYMNGKISSITIPSTIKGYHYIEIKHRNSIETWSDSVDFSTDTVRYDFYNYISQFALDGGMYLNNNHAFIWGGDVNQNGNLESADATNIYVAANSDDPTVNNGYVICDIDGNGNLDSQDYGLAYNNANLGANIINPFSYLKKK